MTATLSVLGLYRANPNLFRDFLIPTDLDKDTLVDNLLAECAELEAIYPDADFMQFMIGAWSKKENPVWSKMCATLHLEYDPIANFDRHEEYTDTSTGSSTKSGTSTRTGSGTSTDNTTHTGTSTTDFDSSVENTGTSSDTRTDNTKSKLTGSDTDTESVSAFNSSGFENARKTEKSLNEETSNTGTVSNTATTGSTSTGTDKTENTVSDTTNRTGSNESTDSGSTSEEASNNASTQHTARLWGNIGVTTSQQMLQSELEINKINLMDVIIDSFKRRFCLLVY